MGLYEREIQELREMNRQIITKQISGDEVRQRVAVYSQIEKRAKMVYHASLVESQYGAKAKRALLATNLVGNGIAIAVESEGASERIVCPERAGVIPRSDCLDYSGDPDNFHKCESCQQFATTRRALLPAGEHA